MKSTDLIDPARKVHPDMIQFNIAVFPSKNFFNHHQDVLGIVLKKYSFSERIFSFRKDFSFITALPLWVQEMNKSWNTLLEGCRPGAAGRHRTCAI